MTEQPGTPPHEDAAVADATAPSVDTTRSLDTALAIGIDAGGTSTRAAVRTISGTVVGTAKGAGANPNAHPPELAAARVADVAAEALGQHDPARVGAAVLGLAGDSKLVDPHIAGLFEQEWRRTGVGCELAVRSDVEIAFASATPQPQGTALVAGTGSIAVGLRGHRMAGLAGGYGWLLGDEGSGFWLGREAVRACLDALLAGQELGPLARWVYHEAAGEYVPETAFGPRRAQSSRVITAANAEAPVRLARFAPLVGEAALAGDRVAVDILDRGVEYLTGLVRSARGEDSGPVVLTGGLVGPGGPLTDRLVKRLEQATGTAVLLAGDGAAGAAWLAASRLDARAPHDQAGRGR